MNEVLRRISKLRQRLLHFNLLGHVYKCTCRLQSGIPESIKFVTFCFGNLYAFISYLQTLISLIEQMQRFFET